MVIFRLKSFVYVLIIFLISPFFSFPISAHLAGQQPFLEINGNYANLYPVPLTSLYNFDLPQDLSPDNYLVNQSISFELDKTRLPAPAEIIEKTKFDWDFADGGHAQGLITQHTFKKIGSYILKIYADDNTTPKPQIIESVLINILPNNNYKLPQAKIVINNKESKDPLTDFINADLSNPLKIEGSKSTSDNSIAEYFWDFGDQKSAFGTTQTHKYSPDLPQVFVVLRIKDSNGFLADNFVEIQNNLNGQKKYGTPSASGSQTSQGKKSNQLPLILSILGAFIVLIVMVRLYFPGLRRGKH